MERVEAAAAGDENGLDLQLPAPGESIVCLQLQCSPGYTRSRAHDTADTL